MCQFVFSAFVCDGFSMTTILILFKRGTEVFFMFGVRAFVTGAFQAAYVYTPEVRADFSFLDYQTFLLMTAEDYCVLACKANGLQN